MTPQTTLRHITLAASLLAAPLACNTHPADTLDQSLDAERLDHHELLSSRLDVLFVIDNSGSMCEEQQSLRDTVDVFVRHLAAAGVDFQIGVTTTDMMQPTHQGRLQNVPDGTPGPACTVQVDLDTCPGTLDPDDLPPRIIRSTDPRYLLPDGELDVERLSLELGCSATVGTRGSGFEMGLLAAVTALSPALLNTTNQGLLRDDADLAILFLTDENDCSTQDPDLSLTNGNACEWERHRLTPVQDLASALYALKPAPEQLLFAGIFAPDNGLRFDPPQEVTPACSSPHGTGFAGYRYQQLIDASPNPASSAFNICDPQSFEQHIDRLGLTIAESLNRRCLRATPEHGQPGDPCPAGGTCAPRAEGGLAFCPAFTLQVELLRPLDAAPLPLATCTPEAEHLRCILQEDTHYTIRWNDPRCDASRVSVELTDPPQPQERVIIRYPTRVP